MFACAVAAVAAEADNIELPAVLDQRVFLQILSSRNVDVRYSRLNAKASENLRNAEAALYEPVAYGSVRQEGRDRQRTFEERVQNLQTASAAVLEEQVNVREVGVRGKLPSGGDVSASYKVTERQNNIIATSQTGASEYNGALVLSYKQPLLRGAGRNITETDRQIAEIEYQLALAQVRQQLYKAGADGLATYWQAYKAQETTAFRQDAFNNVLRLVDDTKARIEAGKAPAAALVELESVFLSREAELLRSRQLQMESVSKLLTSLNLSAADSGGLKLAPSWDAAQPSAVDAQAGGGVASAAVLAAWSPLQLAELKLKQADLRLRFAANQMKPSVDLVMSYSGTGLAASRSPAIDSALSAKYPDWFVGINVELPVYGNKKSESQYLAQAQRRDQAELEIEAIKVSFGNDLKLRWQDLSVSEDLLSKARADLHLRLKLDLIERERYRLGMGSISAMIQKEADLIEARIRLLDGQVRYAVALSTYWYLNGELLSRAGIVFN